MLPSLLPRQCARTPLVNNLIKLSHMGGGDLSISITIQFSSYQHMYRVLSKHEGLKIHYCSTVSQYNQVGGSGTIASEPT